jgi:nicotinate-nucleotide adenylyltransferase
MRRVGIYAGTFDPVHTGHIAFALQAIEQAGLDEVIFLPERRPRLKTGVEHFGHRVAMLNRAVRPHPKLSVAEIVDARFNVQRTLPRLKKTFPGATLVLLMGSDVAVTMPYWPDSDKLLKACELVIGVRGDESVEAAEAMLASWAILPKASYVCKSYAGHISSRAVRAALQRGQQIHGVLASVTKYARRNWLYVAIR